ncbi:nitrogen regulation protein NR(II) [Rheinheimera sp. MMS21-TC3]|uniref:nitrogen regulation protein NR(II) n=1 Tax=Rheinheimera sp. MMS21-TC3 TaxID=3072790 RepID=UPI0028C39639|nr:nitrogen regulation protein NR(II) [Rheinheimera sp. MMS21-TC3]WNO60399.1 nitrogen regulation protein NR(II) [Rheinheimera sp. MMS21-TC3]
MHTLSTQIDALISKQLTTAVLLLDSQLTVCYFNTASSALLGLGEKRLLNQPFCQLFQYNDINIQRLYKAVTEQQNLNIPDVKAISLDSRYLLLDIIVTYCDSPAQHLLLEIRQIDQQRKISLESLQQHQHLAARDLIRNLAHEVKNPLGGLRGAAQLLELSLDAEQTEYTQLIIAQVDRLTNLVDRLLGPYRPPKLVQNNLHQMIEQVRQLALMDNPHQIQFTLDYDPSIPDFPFDTDLLQQALLNIIRNAQQILVNNGRIILQTRVLFQHTLQGKRYKLVAVIKVIDNGPGIAEEIKDTLFYPMVSTQPQGNGLGLSIAQTLLHQHGGWIDCDSWPGHTEFSLYLPIVNSED